MKKLIVVVIGLASFLSFSYAQTLAARITNARVVGSEFKWDIEINRTDDWGTGGGNDVLGNCDFYFYVNVTGFTSGNPVVSNIHSSLDGNTNYVFSTGRASGGSQCYIALTYDSFGGGTNWYPPLNSWELLFTATLNIQNENENSGLAWHETSTGFSRGNNQPLTAVLSVVGNADISLANPSYVESEGINEFPENFVLHQNYPNPFNPMTQIIIDIPKNISDNNSSIEIFNVSGAIVKKLFSGKISAGTHNFIWDATSDRGLSVPSGVYFFRFSSPGFNRSIKMTLIK